MRVAVIVATVSNIFRGKGKKAMKAEDILKSEPARQSWQNQLKKVEMLNQAFKGKDLRKKKNG